MKFGIRIFAIIVLLSAIVVAYEWSSISHNDKGYTFIYDDLGPDEIVTRGSLLQSTDVIFLNSSYAIKVPLDTSLRVGSCKGKWLHYKHETKMHPRRRSDDNISYLVTYLYGETILTRSHCYKKIEIKTISTQEIAAKYSATKPHQRTMVGFLKWEGDNSFILRAVRLERDFLISGIQSRTLHVREIEYRDDLDHWGKPIKSNLQNN